MVKNILKDGTEVKDLTGIVIRESDFPAIYHIIKQIESKEEKDDKWVRSSEMA